MRRLWRAGTGPVTAYDAGKSLEALEKELGHPSMSACPPTRARSAPPLGGRGAPSRGAPRPSVPGRRIDAAAEALGRRLGVGRDWLVVGNGADELLALIARAAFDPGDEVLIPHPAFEPYGTEATLSGATVVEPTPGLRDGSRRHARRVTPRTKAVIICTPHNPASTIVLATEARAIPRLARRRSAAGDPRRGLPRLLRRSRRPPTASSCVRAHPR